MANLEEVFVTEGRPTITYVDPPNYAELLVDIRGPGKPVIVEGQSGTGKTTVVLTILESILPGGYEYLTPRNPKSLSRITEVASGIVGGTVVIDDFHRLSPELQISLTDIAKTKADLGAESDLPKLVLIGINKLGEALIQTAHDIARRLGIHRIEPASRAEFDKLQEEGESALNVRFIDSEQIWHDSRGDYWLIQRLLRLVCTQNNVVQTTYGVPMELKVDMPSLRALLTADLSSAYHNITKEFCRGRRFRPGNDPYYKLLRAVADQDEPLVDIKLLANHRKDLRQSINNIKDHRLKVLIDEKSNLGTHFHYNSGNASFSIEDQALFFYLENLDWDKLRSECGFREASETFEFDAAISFAGENRPLAEMIADRLTYLDFNIFYDKYYEANFLGQTWSDQFERIFGKDSRFVICLLDEFYRKKIWPTFERASFAPRLSDGDVLPIYLDDTIFVEVPNDTIGIHFKNRDRAMIDVSDVDAAIIEVLMEKLDRDA